MTTVFDRSSRTFDWRATRERDVVRIALHGELDLAASDGSRSSFAEAIGDDDKIVVVDLGSLSFMDSTGLRVLADLKKQMDARGGRLLLARLSKPVERLLSVTGLLSWFDYLDGCAPATAYCPVCDGEVVGDANQCVHCGSVF